MDTVNGNFFLFFFFTSFAVIVPSLHAHIAEFDDYWKQRANDAKEATADAYNPDPFNVTNQLNYQVNKATVGSNSTRRNLKGNKLRGGPCEATNPIDRCWRCDPNWANNRKRLADCVLGFAHQTTGGKNGKFYEVTDPSDDDMVNPKPGTLRHAVIQKGPLWITFAHNMIIKLKQELIMTSDKTIDARGANVRIAGGAGLMLQFIKNVIIHGLHIHDIVSASGGLIRDSVDHFGFRTKSDGDGISIFGSSNIWIDHVSMSNCEDGMIDAVMASSAITISNCHFTHHDKVLLFGASDTFSGDKQMQVTIAFNHFGKGLVQRMPRCRWGFMHVVNNDYTQWHMYAIGGSQNPAIISQGNRYVAPNDINAKQVTKRDQATESEWKNWNWKSEGDVMVNGAFFVESGNRPTGSQLTQMNMIQPKPGTLVAQLTRHSGSLDCFVGKPC